MSGSASAILCKSGCGRSRRILLFLAERVAASFCYGCGGAGMGCHSASVSGWRGAGVSRASGEARFRSFLTISDRMEARERRVWKMWSWETGFQPVGFQGAHHVRIA